MTVSTRSSSSVGHFAGKKLIKYFDDDKMTDERDVKVVKFATHGDYLGSLAKVAHRS